MNDTKFTVLTHMGEFVYEPRLGDGIYGTDKPVLHDWDDTIPAMVDRAETVRDLIGKHHVPDSYFENLQKCCLVDFYLVQAEFDPMEKDNPPLTYHLQLTCSSSAERQAVVERAFETIEKQKEYIELLGQELSITAGIATAHGWKSNLAEQGEKLRAAIKFLQGGF